MGDFKQGGGSRFSGGHKGHGGGFGGRGGSFGGRGNDRGPITMHKAVCDECKKPCEVPFNPTAGKPVYCNACFGGKKEVGGNDRGGFQKKSFGDYKTPSRTDFGNDVKKVSGEEIKKQIEVLNVKIDRLTSAIEKITVAKPVVVEVKELKEKEIKKVAPVKKVVKAVKKVSKKK